MAEYKISITRMFLFDFAAAAPATSGASRSAKRHSFVTPHPLLRLQAEKSTMGKKYLSGESANGGRTCLRILHFFDDGVGKF